MEDISADSLSKACDVMGKAISNAADYLFDKHPHGFEESLLERGLNNKYNEVKLWLENVAATSDVDLVMNKYGHFCKSMRATMQQKYKEMFKRAVMQAVSETIHTMDKDARSQTTVWRDYLSGRNKQDHEIELVRYYSQKCEKLIIGWQASEDSCQADIKSIKTELMQSLPIEVNNIFERSKRKISEDEQIDVMQQALRRTLDQMTNWERKTKITSNGKNFRPMVKEMIEKHKYNCKVELLTKLDESKIDGDNYMSKHFNKFVEKPIQIHGMKIMENLSQLEEEDYMESDDEDEDEGASDIVFSSLNGAGVGRMNPVQHTRLVSPPSVGYSYSHGSPSNDDSSVLRTKRHAQDISERSTRQKIEVGTSSSTNKKKK